MKAKIKNFFIEKKELLIFVGILTIIFAAVITVASISLNNDAPAVDLPPSNTITDVITGGDDTGNIEPKPVATFGLPVNQSAKLIRCYYDMSKDNDSLVSAVISYGNTFYESKGVTYANEDDSEIKVYAIYDGVVKSVISDEIHGTIITILHENNVSSYYSSLSSASVKENDEVSKGDLIGVGGKNLFDVDASNHVYLEVKVSDFYVDPEAIYTKDIAYVASMMDQDK